jgi:hypothetical protein
LRDERDGAGLPPDKVLEADTDVGTIWVDEGGHILTDMTPPRAKREFKSECHHSQECHLYSSMA